MAAICSSDLRDAGSWYDLGLNSRPAYRSAHNHVPLQCRSRDAQFAFHSFHGVHEVHHCYPLSTHPQFRRPLRHVQCLGDKFGNVLRGSNANCDIQVTARIIAWHLCSHFPTIHDIVSFVREAGCEANTQPTQAAGMEAFEQNPAYERCRLDLLRIMS